MGAMKARQSESGNVMFYILIAVVLLAALSFAISQGGRGGNSELSRERQRLLASEILEYSDTVKKAVQILRLRGVGFDQLDFDSPGLAGYNNAACATGDCMIFDLAGGAVVYKEASPDVMAIGSDWIFAANNEVEGIGTTTGTADSAELLMILQPLKKEICANINDRLGVPNNGAGDDPPDDADIDISLPFTGGDAYSQTVGDEAGATKLGHGLQAACFREVSSGNYTFYQVLIAR